jgi:hypothetical protein
VYQHAPNYGKAVHSHRSVPMGNWLQDPLQIIKIHGCSNPLHKIAYHLHINYIYLLFKSSLNYMYCLVPCKCYVKYLLHCVVHGTMIRKMSVHVMYRCISFHKYFDLHLVEFTDVEHVYGGPNVFLKLYLILMLLLHCIYLVSFLDSSL